MELQWPLILFTTFIAWSAGLFATQGAFALKGEAPKAQLPALACSLVLMGVGGVAVFFHLQHWERIFNGFGHLSSGITQELICIVLMVVAMVVFFVYLRRDEKMPQWAGWAAVAASALLVIVMGHSYMMAARPGWNSVLEVCSLLGAACAMGPATMAVVASFAGGAESDAFGTFNLGGFTANAVFTVAYVAAMALASSSFTHVSYYFDPTLPTEPIVDLSVITPFTGDALMPTVAAIVLVLAGLGAAFMGKKGGNWKLWGAVALIAAFVASIVLRMAFYAMGVSVYPFYSFY